MNNGTLYTSASSPIHTARGYGNVSFKNRDWNSPEVGSPDISSSTIYSSAPEKTWRSRLRTAVYAGFAVVALSCGLASGFDASPTPAEQRVEYYDPGMDSAGIQMDSPLMQPKGAVNATIPR